MKPDYDEAAEILNKESDVSSFILILWHIGMDNAHIFASIACHKIQTDFTEDNKESREHLCT